MLPCQIYLETFKCSRGSQHESPDITAKFTFWRDQKSKENPKLKKGSTIERDRGKKS